MHYNWNLPSQDLTQVEQFLQVRELDKSILKSDINNLPSENLFKDIDKAINRIIKAIKNNEKIIIFGHDDLDGITSCFLIFDYLTDAGSINHYYYLPNRAVDRHGICQNLIDFAVAYEAKLIISVDNGISSVKEVSDLNDLGIDTIILDHHIPAQELPPAYAIVNPKQGDCQHPDKMLAGVGVCFFIVKKLCQLSEIKFKEIWYFWTAVGTIADKVPLQGSNRVFVKYVLNNYSSFLKDVTLSYVFNQQKKNVYSPSKMGFINYLIRILYNGRELNGKNKSFQFIIANQFEKEVLFQELSEIKEQNDMLIKQNLQSIDELFLKEMHNYTHSLPSKYQLENTAFNEIEDDIFIYYESDKPMLVLIIDKKHNFAYSLLGIHASYIYSELKIPVIMIKPKDEKHYVAEARGPKWFNLVECFTYCQDAFIQYGGHIKAAGFLIENDKIDLFKQKLMLFFKEKKFLLPEPQTHINIDAIFNNFNKDEIDSFYTALEPFGQGFSEPVVLIKNYSYREEDKYYFYNLAEEITIGGLWNLVVSINEHGNFKIKDYKKNT
ncbi:MAG: DHH family phosphoesterase [Candidatus Cloacimonetes bacterium]|nr:DHH family phosphoesterase [Candidatus Cloacimonadota bacterium]